MAKRFFLFIVFLRALAAIVITNSHYTGVYPTDLIANGGLLGDILFFAISGYCLTNITLPFRKWYKKRFLRIYTVVWIISFLYFLIGKFNVDSFYDFVQVFVWPTNYHFVGSIILLYVPFYFINKYSCVKGKYYAYIALILLFIQIVIYLTIYDISYYHIDVVREPMIWFIFLQSMLLGASYRNKEIKPVDKKSLRFKIIVLFVLLISYFCSKICFVKNHELSEWQLVNQFLVFFTLYSLFDIFSSIEFYLTNRVPVFFKKIANFLADHTLEIYLVQSVIISSCNIGTFPFNWFLITAIILVSAYILRRVSLFIIQKINI